MTTLNTLVFVFQILDHVTAVIQHDHIDPTKIISFLAGAESKCPQEVTILAWNRLH